ncbi:hypothetical protein ACTFTM_09425 [Micromonospora sp. RB23]
MVVVVWRYALRLGALVAGSAGVVLTLAAPAQAAFATEMSGLPARFTAGDQVRTISAVVSQTDRRGGCAKVRWSMVLRVQGIRLDQVKMDRVEENGDFPVEIRTEGDVARLTDRQLDPGTLCPGRTVTARYRVAFAEDVTQGRVTLAAEAYDANLRLLARQTVTRSVVGAGAPEPVRRRRARPPRGPAIRRANRRRRRAFRPRNRSWTSRSTRRPRRPAVRSRRPAGSVWCRRRSCSVGCCSRSGRACCCDCAT